MKFCMPPVQEWETLPSLNWSANSPDAQNRLSFARFEPRKSQRQSGECDFEVDQLGKWLPCLHFMKPSRWKLPPSRGS